MKLFVLFFEKYTLFLVRVASLCNVARKMLYSNQQDDDDYVADDDDDDDAR